MIYGLGLALVCLSWLLPGHYFPWTGFQQEFLAAVGTCLLALSVVVRGGSRRIEVPWIGMLWIALAAIPVLQRAGGLLPFLSDAVLPSTYLVGFGLSIVIGCALTRTEGRRFVATLLAAIVLAGMVSTGIGMAQSLQLGPIAYVEMLDPGGRVFGNFTQPNHLSSLLALGLVGVLWFYESRRINGAVISLATAFLGAGMVMAQSRTGWVVVCVLVIWWLSMHRRLALRTSAVSVGAAVGLFIAATLAWPPLNGYLLDQNVAGELSLSGRFQGEGRPIFWETIWDAVCRKPWLGYGWQQVIVAQQAAALDHPAAHETISYSHNLILDLLVWNGLPLALVVSALFAWWFVARCVSCRDVDTWAMLAAVGALLVHALVEFPYAYTYFLLPLGITIGVIEARALSAETGRSLRMPSWAFALASLAISIVLAWIAVEYVQVEDASRQVRMKEAGYTAGRLPPELPPVVLLDSEREFLWFRLAEVRTGMDNKTLDRLRDTTRRFSPPAALLRYALAAGLNGRDADAERSLQLLCSLWSPKYCRDARESWKDAQIKSPQLAHISFPGDPTGRATERVPRN